MHANKNSVVGVALLAALCPHLEAQAAEGCNERSLHACGPPAPQPFDRHEEEPEHVILSGPVAGVSSRSDMRLATQLIDAPSYRRWSSREFDHPRQPMPCAANSSTL